VISGEEVIVVEGETIGPVDEIVDLDVCCINELYLNSIDPLY
jgi:hypothetical protein